MRKKFTESQIVASIKKQESVIAVKDNTRDLGISDATFYNWKAKLGGMKVTDIARMRELEEENSEIKKMYAKMRVKG